MIILLALLAAVLIGLLVGLAWRGVLLVTDQRTLDLLVNQLAADLRIDSRTKATLRAMQDAARSHYGRPATPLTYNEDR